MATRPEPQFEEAEDLREFYVDSVQVSTQLYTCVLNLGDLRANQPSLIRLRVKVSPQTAKVLGLILSKHIRNYEERFGEIGIPTKLYHDLGLEEYI